MFGCPLCGDCCRYGDVLWLTLCGDGVQWYFEAKASKPAVCKYKPAAENCATSCQTKLECLESIQKEDQKLYFAWDRINLMTPAHANGSICLGRGLEKNTVVRECTQWYVNFPSMMPCQEYVGIS